MQRHGTIARKQKNTGNRHGVINRRSTEARVMEGYWSLCVCLCVCVWCEYCVQTELKVYEGDTDSVCRDVCVKVSERGRVRDKEAL